MNPEVDKYFSRAGKWQEEMKQLRAVALDCGLTEELKWGKPCYAFQGKNIIIIQPFKEYCALLFFKGYLLTDPNNILIKTGENTIVGRQLRFTNIREIVKIAPVLKTYIYEAIEVEKAGVKAEPQEKKDIQLPIELKNKFKQDPAFKNAFNLLTPGRQRAYIFYFSQAKQSETRTARIEKYTSHILNGKGLTE